MAKVFTHEQVWGELSTWPTIDLTQLVKVIHCVVWIVCMIPGYFQCETGLWGNACSNVRTHYSFVIGHERSQRGK